MVVQASNHRRVDGRMGELTGKVAVVPGASKGIGAGSAKGLGEIAPAVVFLASGDSGWVTGESIRVSGGLQ
jgi:NAD(P)-dependent dehydrogenase (short-subunit alcohol dehydrogenase family)